MIKSFILDNTTGVVRSSSITFEVCAVSRFVDTQMFVGSFEPTDFNQFQFDVQTAIENFQAANITRLLIDLTNNGGRFTCLDSLANNTQNKYILRLGGFVCLGLFLHQFLAGLDSGYPYVFRQFN